MGKKAENYCLDGESVRNSFSNIGIEKPVRQSIIIDNQDVSDYLNWLDEFEKDSMQSRLVVK